MKYGMRISPVFSDFLEKAHEMWQQDKQEDGESEDEEGEEEYLPLYQRLRSRARISIHILARHFFWKLAVDKRPRY